MTVTLDAATELRIQTELAKGRYREPSEIIAHALDLFEAEQAEPDVARAQLAMRLQHSFDQSERGETYSPEDARAILAARLAARR